MNYQCCIKPDLLPMSYTVIVLIIRIHQEAVPFRNLDRQIIYQQSMAIDAN